MSLAPSAIVGGTSIIEGSRLTVMSDQGQGRKRSSVLSAPKPPACGGLGGTRHVAVGAGAPRRPAHPSGPRRVRRAPNSEPGDVLVCRAHDARRGTGAGAGPLLPAERDLASDGTWLRGSVRDATDALRSVTLAGVTVGQVWAQRAVSDGDELAAALALLEAFPLEGKVISADAGLVRPPFVQKVVKKRGVYRAD